MEAFMNKKRKTGRLILIVVFLLVWGTSACATESDTNPQAWIDYPAEGMSVPVGTNIIVTSHGFAREGIAEFVLSVNGAAYRRDVPAEPGATFAKIQQPWVATEAGTFRLQAQVYDSKGESGNSAPVIIEVGGGIDPIPVVPVITDTPTPPPPTTITITVPPASSINFYAAPTEIEAGGCAKIIWNVENAQRVIFGGIDQPLTGAYDACLCESERYTLKVVDFNGSEITREANVSVTGSCVTVPPPAEELPPPAAADTTPPPVPNPAVPANGLDLSCRSTQTLAWLPVTDPSGVSYYVKLEIEVKKDKWQSVGGYGPITGKQVDVNVQCGGIYRWNVRAQDGAGNYSEASPFSSFSVTLN
jgi:hypothetical protein